MRWFLKNNGMSRVIFMGLHPMMDFVAISSGIEKDIRYIPFLDFFSNYSEEK